MVAGRNLMAEFFCRHAEVEGFDCAAWRHHVFNRDVLEFEQINQDAAVLQG